MTTSEILTLLAKKIRYVDVGPDGEILTTPIVGSNGEGAVGLFISAQGKSPADLTTIILTAKEL